MVPYHLVEEEKYVEVKTQDLTFLRINCISFGIFIKLYCTCIHKCI